MVVFDRHRFYLDARQRRQGHLPAARGGQVDIGQRGDRVLDAGTGFQDHPVLVRFREDRRDDALPEGVVQCVVDGRGGDAVAGRGVAVHRHIGRKAAIQIVRGDVLELRRLGQAVHDARNPLVEDGGAGVFKYELIAGAADRRIDRQILHRLQIERDAGNLVRQVQNPAHGRGDGAALALGLQVDQHAAAVQRRVRAVHADEG